MKRHQLASAVSVGALDDVAAAPGLATRGQPALGKIPRSEHVASEASFAPISVSVRTHTLILTGELHRGSVLALEAEIERLCEEGVSGITLDLRKLDSIDSVGVAVIAFRSGLCQRRGCGFTLIRGSQSIDRAFDEAGVTRTLRFEEDELEPRRPALVLSHGGRDVASLDC